MDEIEKNLIQYIKEINTAKVTLSQLKGIEIDSMDIQLALCEKLNIESMQPADLLDRRLSSGEMINILRDYKFSKPDVLEEITLKE